jgi:hypothetical protein
MKEQPGNSLSNSMKFCTSYNGLKRFAYLLVAEAEKEEGLLNLVSVIGDKRHYQCIENYSEVHVKLVNAHIVRTAVAPILHLEGKNDAHIDLAQDIPSGCVYPIQVTEDAVHGPKGVS